MFHDDCGFYLEIEVVFVTATMPPGKMFENFMIRYDRNDSYGCFVLDLELRQFPQILIETIGQFYRLLRSNPNYCYPTGKFDERMRWMLPPQLIETLK